MKVNFPLVSLGFIALAAWMIHNQVSGHGWVILCAILTATSFLMDLTREEKPTGTK